MADNWTATYRLQLHRGFDLSCAAAAVPYLARLGISHVYLSPVLQAAPGSTHGYDVADPLRINEELGGEEGWQALQASVRRHGLKVLLDIVPNHMSASSANPWWEDLLSRGPFSACERTFDVAARADGGRWCLRLCTLGKPYAEALAAGELRVEAAEAGLPRIYYYEQSWPLSPGSWASVMPPADGALTAMLDELRRLQHGELPGEGEVERLRALAETAAGDIRELGSNSRWRSDLRERCTAVSADADAMHDLLEQQFYKLCWWKSEGELVNYRRFFNIASLVGVAIERDDVFERTHARIRRMIEAGELDGLRVDHPDGLRDPLGYLQRLRQMFPQGRIYVEKILDAEEELPSSWPVDGTVGYDFLDRVGRLWMDEQKSDALTAAYHDFTGHTVNYPALVRAKKLEIVATSFEADLVRLTSLAMAAAEACCRAHDLSRRQMRQALELLTCMLPVYRTYLRASATEPAADGSADEKNWRLLLDALGAARAQAAGVQPQVFDALEKVLTGDGELSRELLARWQQLTPAVTAKGAEDTTFYLYDRLLSCNEVGSQPSLLGISTDRFHQFCSHIASRWPRSLLGTSTHDTKRSEDVRCRIDVLTEAVEAWAAALRSWSARNQPAWKGRKADKLAEYLLYQTLVGAWPIDAERAWLYMQKACREAKIHTSWHEPDEDYENGVHEFLDALFADADFVAELEALVTQIGEAGRINSLAQTLIKLTAPGTPDFYQGTERWSLSLVDPDNRRPVDFGALQGMLERAESMTAAQAMAEMESGMPKLWLILTVLRLRRQRPELFGADAAYHPHGARGPRLQHLLSYIRAEELMVVVPRFTLALAGQWEDTVVPLPDGQWDDVLGGGSFRGEAAPEHLFGAFPVALLLRR
ncbi:MAG TPA: malto-oligosyltrehalose synthase [Candidatus Limnocylindrales bacterium]|nr:malto-oligosyltrehalose synthase [Candidatus Limnocylindrales bacterium]